MSRTKGQYTPCILSYDVPWLAKKSRAGERPPPRSEWRRSPREICVLKSERRSEDYGYLKQQLVQGDHLAVQNDITRAQLLPDPIAELSNRRRRLPRFDPNWQSWPVRYSTHGIRCTSARSAAAPLREGVPYLRRGAGPNSPDVVTATDSSRVARSVSLGCRASAQALGQIGEADGPGDEGEIGVAREKVLQVLSGPHFSGWRCPGWVWLST